MNHAARPIASVFITNLALLVSLPSAAGVELVEFTGRVVDAAGQPAAGLKVSPYWISDGDRWVTAKGARTDAEGRFTVRDYPTSRMRTLMVLDAKQENGAMAPMDTAARKTPILLELQPTTLVQAAFESTGLGREIENVYVAFTAKSATIAVATHRGAPSLSLRLPPGDYNAGIGGVDCQRLSKPVTIPAVQGTVDLGTTDLKPTVIAQYYGKEPPAWNVTDARGVDAKTTLADYKGKWVLLEFWGYW
jgi:hypothetical protein